MSGCIPEQNTCVLCNGKIPTESNHKQYLIDWLNNNENFTLTYLKRHATQNIMDSWMVNCRTQINRLNSASPNELTRFKRSASATNRYETPVDESEKLKDDDHAQKADLSPVNRISSQDFELVAARPILVRGDDGVRSFVDPSLCVRRKSTEVIPRRCLRNVAEGRLDERELVNELVKDICNDLEISTLCYKILRNVCSLLQADRGSLFLVEEHPLTKQRFLVSKLFDVTQHLTLEEYLQRPNPKQIYVPMGVGISGHVAYTGEHLNIPDAYKDPRFSGLVDKETGYRTQSILCMPVKTVEGEVVAVAQVVNKLSKTATAATAAPSSFDEHDVRVFESYLAFCGIGLHNAQLFRESQLETERIQILLELARQIFMQQTDSSRVIALMMKRSLSLLDCQWCQVLLVKSDQRPAGNPPGGEERETDDVFSDMYNLACTMDDVQHFASKDDALQASVPVNFALCAHVARTGQVSGEAKDGWTVRSVLCMPIQSVDNRVLGVCCFVNKRESDLGKVLDAAMVEPRAHVIQAASEDAPLWTGRFSLADESLYEAFAIFAGISIAHTQMYEQIVRTEAKSRITLDVLSYHAMASPEDAEELSRQLIPSSRYLHLCSFSFTDFNMSDDDTMRACMRMFTDLNLIEAFRIPRVTLSRWLLSVKKNYRQVTYHNWRHAFNVAQTMFAIMTTAGFNRVFGALEQMAVLVACLSHDLDHRGTNNQFQIRTMSPLADLYSTSVMEHHHFDQCLMLLTNQGNEIFANLNQDEYTHTIKLIESCILATDLSVHFSLLPKFRALVDANVQHVNPPSARFWASDASKFEMLASMLMSTCDVSAITKPWPIQKKTAELVACEFFEQGDLERQRFQTQPQAIVCVSDTLKPLLDGCEANRECWNSVADARPIPPELMRLSEGDTSFPAAGPSTPGLTSPVVRPFLLLISLFQPPENVAYPASVGPLGRVCSRQKYERLLSSPTPELTSALSADSSQALTTTVGAQREEKRTPK